MSWLSKRKTAVSLSTTEAEYVAAATASRKAVWLPRLVRVGTGQEEAMQMHCDSTGALAMMDIAVVSARTKHVDVAHHWVREKVASKELTVSHVSTKDMVADVLTKLPPAAAFDTCLTGLALALNL